MSRNVNVYMQICRHINIYDLLYTCTCAYACACLHGCVNGGACGRTVSQTDKYRWGRQGQAIWASLGWDEVDLNENVSRIFDIFQAVEAKHRDLPATLLLPTIQTTTTATWTVFIMSPWRLERYTAHFHSLCLMKYSQCLALHYLVSGPQPYFRIYVVH